MAFHGSSVKEMAELEKAFDLDAPATILRYNVLDNLSMQLSIKGALVNWKNVADKLGFSNLEISGKYDNFAGSEGAMKMLNDWILRKFGKIRELVEVFLSLELYACIEDLKEDLKKYSQQSKKVHYGIEDEDGSNPSRNDESLTSAVTESSAPSSSITGSTSAPESYQTTEYPSHCSSGPCSELSTVADSSLQSNNSSAISSLPCPYDNTENTKSSKESSPTIASGEDRTQQSECSPKNDTKSPGMPEPSVSLIQRLDWPEYRRSISEPPEKINKTKPKLRRHLFFRSKSCEGETKNPKKKLRIRFLGLKNRNKKKEQETKKDTASTYTATADENTASTSVTVQGFYREEASTLNPNMSPLIVAEEKLQRPVSSGSEDSLPFTPSSPTSPGYESGYHSGDNSFKRIYIVCSPDEEDVFQRAIQLYFAFCKKGYECHMFATDLKEVMEVGRFRYEMQQVREADFVFICVSKKLKEIFEVAVSETKKFKDDDTKGLRHVSDFMMTFFAKDCCNKNGKFMAILLKDDSYNHVPFVMDSYLKYQWPKQEKRMENTIHQRSEIPLPPVSDVRFYAPVKVCTPKGVVKASVKEDDTKG